MNATDFSGFQLNKQLLNALADAGFRQPTPIQQQAIPKILSGQQVVGIAQTGTGKTAAYLLPLLMKLKYPQGDWPRLLVLVPTRELAVQVNEQVQLLGKYTGLRSIALFGGTGTKKQKETIEQGIDIVVATPGRLMDLHLPGFLSLKKIETLVLDEAERLLDMGFRKQIQQVLDVLPRKRQNILFSATLHEKVKSLYESFIDFPAIIHIEPEIKTAKTVSQEVFFVPNIKTKINLLLHLVRDPAMNKVILFCKTRDMANNLFKYLSRTEGEQSARVIHGNKEQNTRLNAFRDFEAGKVRFLVTTDVAARGLDIAAVSHVINFDVPLVYEDYIHRIGRTGRAFSTGHSITFCAPNDEYHLKKIQKLIGNKIPAMTIPAEVEIAETPAAEKQQMLRDIDHQRRKEDPEFQGAFHEKKNKRTFRKKHS